MGDLEIAVTGFAAAATVGGATVVMRKDSQNSGSDTHSDSEIQHTTIDLHDQNLGAADARIIALELRFNRALKSADQEYWVILGGSERYCEKHIS